MKSDIQRMKSRIKKAKRRIDRGVRVEEELDRVNRLTAILAAKGITPTTAYPATEKGEEWTTN